jgi:hypothetical protein
LGASARSWWKTWWHGAPSYSQGSLKILSKAKGSKISKTSENVPICHDQKITAYGHPTIFGIPNAMSILIWIHIN